MRVGVGDVELYVHEKGAGRPLIALHGGPGLDGSVWFPALDPLAEEGWHVLAVDLRGNGRSDGGDPALWTVDRMADDVFELTRVLGLAPPVLMGWSFGSFVVQSHMARHGDARAYVLIGTVSRPAAIEDVAERLAVFEPERLRAQVTDSWAREAVVRTPEECKQLLADQMPFHFADPEGPLVRRWIDSDQVVYRPDVLRHFAAGGDYGMTDMRERLRTLDRPVLVVSGAHDRTTPARSAQELVDVIPAAEHVVLEHSAHMSLYEQPEAFQADLRGFLDRV
jgi:pimeloyl-ACP methyl ester carboxylesterase